MVAPCPAAKREREELVGLGPGGRRDQKKSQFGAVVAPDGGAQFGEAGDARTFAGVVEPTLGGQRGELAGIGRAGQLPPPPHPPDLGFIGEGYLDGPEFPTGFNVENVGFHAVALVWLPNQ